MSRAKWKRATDAVRKNALVKLRQSLRRKFANKKATRVRVAKGLSRKIACHRAIKKTRGDFRGCSYNSKTGVVTLR